MSALSRGLCTSVYLASRARASARPPSASVARPFTSRSVLCRSQHSPRRAALARRGSAQALFGQAGACAGPTAALPAAAQPAAPAGRRRRARGQAPARTQTARRRWRAGSRAAAAQGTAGRASPGTAAGGQWGVRQARRPAGSCAAFAADCQRKEQFGVWGHAERACDGKEGCWCSGHM